MRLVRASTMQPNTVWQTVLQAMWRVGQRSGRDDLQLNEIVTEAQRISPQYAVSSIRTHVVSRLCVNAPANHACRYPFVERTGYGTYRLTSAGREQARGMVGRSRPA